MIARLLDWVLGIAMGTVPLGTVPLKVAGLRRMASVHFVHMQRPLLPASPPTDALRDHGIFTSLRDLIFGLEDSIVSTTGVVVGVAAGAPIKHIVILSGAVSVVTQALSMTAGSFLSSQSEREMLEAAIRKEREEIDTKPEEEKAELRQMYKERGFTPDEIEIIVRRVTADKTLWLEEMVSKELRIGTRELDGQNQNAATMFLASVFGGLLPILPFFVLSISAAMRFSIVMAIISLFTIGYFQSKSASLNPWKGGLRMAIISSIAASLAYAVGRIAGALFGIAI